MTGSYFVDSNVVVYARDATDAGKQKRASEWIEALAIADLGRLSYQVIGEAYSALTRPGRLRMDARAAQIYVANFRHWNPVIIEIGVIEEAWRVQDRFQLNWWDCLIVAAARAAECQYLLTEDLQPGQDLDGVLVVNPFETAPDSVQ